ncbi:hypothetical protein BKA70DRAFT_1437187 [Coprinopsis sp. MPI-PUGE-AT-0042]|nr:hypothetical protein BKA70DRAFT_1437187 [Coprinopsis sp. MPI-PUGE-AT-0042]
MRFTALTLVLSCIAMSYARGGSDDLSARDTNEMVLNARELLEDLGMHARALKGAALSARRLEDLEARMFELESGLESIAVRAKSDKYVCPKCDATFNTSKELTSHKDAKGHHKDIAPKGRRG